MISIRTAALAMTAFLLLAPVDALASGQLMVHPTRVIFEGRTRTGEVEVLNNGAESATYRISLIRERMTDSGEFVLVDKPLPGENFADELIRFSPRQVTLPAGGSQLVRLQLRKPADLPAGEYRSHLMLQALPAPATIRRADAAQNGTEGLNVALNAIVSLSIPVIVRQGETTATVSLATLHVKRGRVTSDPPAVVFEIHRQGNRSLYGDIAVSFTQHGKELIVGRANGVAVYVPNLLRVMELPLQLPANQNLLNGRLRVSFSDRPDAGGKLLAEAALDLP